MRLLCMTPQLVGTRATFVRRFEHSWSCLIVLAIAASGLQAQTPKVTGTARSRADETLEWWNHIGNKLIAMARDFPEDKYDFKVEKDQRSFAENILHVASVDFDVAGRVAGRQIGPDFGPGFEKEGHSPTRKSYPTKADVVRVLEQAVAAGAAIIREQGDAGLDKTMEFTWETGKHVSHASYAWLSAIEHSAEHFGQLVVYYRASGLVPPESRH
jgi:uncharacterized damage-inducible protein DinB